MDFFEAQARAKKRTSRLVVLFILAVLGTILASYAVALFAANQTAEYYDDTLWRPALFGGVSAFVLLIVGLGSLSKWAQFSHGGSAVARSVGGKQVDPNTTDLAERRLLNVVEEMAIASGVPMPAVFILPDEPGINAFAAGLTTSDAVVAVTRGTMEKLTRDELQGVVAHEFSHILNGDMRLNLRITAIIFGILVLGLAGRGILWSLRGARVRSSRNDKNGGNVMIVILVVGLSLMLIGYIGYFFGRMIQAAVSRQREFLADASAVQFTRNPAGITGALKKIGGYALGSSLQTSKAASIGHFFFSQAFRSSFGGLWATHPPLVERIRAIDPQFDGKFFKPPEVVDVAEKSFVSAGLHPAKPKAAPSLPPVLTAALIANAGTLAPRNVANAQTLLESIPTELRDAAHSRADAPALVFALLLDSDPTVRQHQLDLVATQAALGPDPVRTVSRLEPHLGSTRAEHRLPLVQLALPALRQLSADAQKRFLQTVDALVKADGRVSTFEFAVDKLLARSLRLAHKPTSDVVEIYSFKAVAAEISIVLSALAQESSGAPEQSFASGAAQLKLIESQLRFTPLGADDSARLDAALDRLATASLPIKQRTLTAAAAVVNADGHLSAGELELIRAFAAALDVPLPLLTADDTGAAG